MRKQVFVFAIKLKPEGSAERSQGAFGGIGFRSLQRGVVHLTRRRATAFTRTVTFANDRCTIGGNRNADPGRVHSEEGATIFSCEDTTGFDGFAAPTIKAEYSVGFRNRVPALDIREFAPIGFAGADVTWIDVTTQGFHLFCGEAHHRTLTLKTGSGLERITPAISVPCLRSVANPCRLRRGSRGSQ